MTDRELSARQRYRWSKTHPNYWLHNAAMLEATGAREFANASRNYAHKLMERAA